ncbi:hypothetical protein ACFL15_02595 [Patescibacteria group bacterium]
MGKEFDPSTLKKWEMFVGLGKGRFLHIKKGDKTKEYGGNVIPSFVSLLYPLVSKLIPQEFENTGRFHSKVSLEDKLVEIFPSSNPEEIYLNVCARLVQKGISAKEAAKVLLDISPLKTYFDTGQISKETWFIFKDSLAHEIINYYPGSVRSLKERKRQLKIGSSYQEGPRGKDGIAF